MNPNKDDIARASQQIGLSDVQIDRLWDALQQVQANKPKSGLLPSFLYLGGLIAFVSMTWFYTGDLADSHVLFIRLTRWKPSPLGLGGNLAPHAVALIPYVVNNILHAYQNHLLQTDSFSL